MSIPASNGEHAGDRIVKQFELGYQTGFANFLCSEALPGALPDHNSPQRCPYGLFAEQFSSTAFTAPRASNRALGSIAYARAPAMSLFRG